VLVLLSELESVDRAAELLEEALGEARASPALLATVLTRLAEATRFRRGFVRALDPARRALRLAEQLDDAELRIEALDVLVFLEIATGRGTPAAHAQQAVELAKTLDDPVLRRKPVEGLASVRGLLGDLDGTAVAPRARVPRVAGARRAVGGPAARRARLARARRG
jgi:hypothetical protein